MSVLIEDSAEAALLAVGRLAADLAKDAQLAAAVATLDAPTLLSRVLATELLSAAGEKDAEAAFLVLSHAAGALPAEQALVAVSLLARRVADAEAVPPPLRLRVLFAAFNVVPHARCRFVVLLRTLELATACDQKEVAALVVGHVDAWAAEWKLETADLRALRFAVYELLEKTKAGGDSRAALKALVAYLALFEARRLACGLLAPRGVLTQSVRAG